MKANCKHCNNEFEQRRSNHKYCKPGCKTMASYKRNNYAYVSGSYRKDNEMDLRITQKDDFNNQAVQNKKLEKKIKGFDKKFNQLKKLIEKGQESSSSLIKATLGPLLVRVGEYAGNKIFCPSNLPASKGDVDEVKKQNKEIQLQNNTILNWIDKQSKRQDLEDSFL